VRGGDREARLPQFRRRSRSSLYARLACEGEEDKRGRKKENRDDRPRRIISLYCGALRWNSDGAVPSRFYIRLAGMALTAREKRAQPSLPPALTCTRVNETATPWNGNGNGNGKRPGQRDGGEGLGLGRGGGGTGEGRKKGKHLGEVDPKGCFTVAIHNRE